MTEKKLEDHEELDLSPEEEAALDRTWGRLSGELLDDPTEFGLTVEQFQTILADLLAGREPSVTGAAADRYLAAIQMPRSSSGKSFPTKDADRAEVDGSG